MDGLRFDGSATLYRLYDVGYAIGLDRAAALLGESLQGRALPRRLEARAIEIRNPPLYTTLGSFDIALGERKCTVQLTAHLYEFGVCSLQLRTAAERGLSWGEFTDFGNALDTSKAPLQIMDREVQLLLDRIAGAVERPEIAPVSEEYKIFRIDRIEGVERPVAAELFTDEDLVRLLVGERRRLGPVARRELVPHRFSYYEDDLVVLSWESALVVEPRVEDRDVEYVLEFANAQLLELRLYDLQLDAEVPRLYDRVEAARARRIPRLAGRFRSLLSDLQTQVADVTETVERVENSLKVINDVYLARVYSTALTLFKEDDWQRSIDRKLGILRDTYAMLNTESQSARTELLEIAVVLLIVAELVLGLLSRR